MSKIVTYGAGNSDDAALKEELEVVVEIDSNGVNDVVPADGYTFSKVTIKTAVNGSGSGVVDDYLSLESTNPVQNKVITEKVTELETNIGNVETLLGTI